MLITINIKHPVPGHHFFLLMALLIVFSCSRNRSSQTGSTVKPVKLKPPVTITAKAPRVILTDTCPPPRKIIIPTKPGGFALRKSIDGLKMIQSVPPETRVAGLYTPMQTYGTEQGLVHTDVKSSCIDKNGNIWFGTGGGGASRYDGKSFTNFTTEHGLANNIVLCIFEDKKENIWFGTFDGASCYDGRSFTNYSMAQGLANNVVSSIFESKTGKLWIATGDGVSLFDPDKKSFTNYTDVNGIAINGIYDILEDKHGNIWFGTEKGVCRMNYNQKSGSDGQPGFSKYQPLGNNRIYCILEDKMGNFWFGTYDGIYKLDRNDIYLPDNKVEVIKYTTTHGLTSGNVMYLTEDKAGNIWAGTYGGGASRLCPGNLSLPYAKAVIMNYTTAEGLSDNLVQTISEDKNGNIWIGTSAGGVSRLDQGGRSINSFTPRQGIINNIIWTIREDKKGNTWFGTEGGLSRLDPYEKSFTNYTTAQGLVDYLSRCIIEDKNGNICFSTESGGMSRFDREAKTITTFTTAQGLVSNDLISVLKDKNGDLWFGTYGGVSRFDGKSFTNYTTEQGLVNNFVISIFEDKSGNLWFGTYGGGISRYDGKSFTNFTTDQGLTNNVVNCIFGDDAGNLWFGTFGGGLNRFDGKSFINYTTADGMADNMINDIVMDKKGLLWLGTNKGFTVLKGFLKDGKHKPGSPEKVDLGPSNLVSNDELKSGELNPVFEIYNVHTGYPVKEIIPRAMYVTHDDKIWAGTNDKLVKFDYSAIRKNPDPPLLFIQNLKINNENVCWYDLEKGDKRIDSNTTAPYVTEEITHFGRLLSEERRDTLGKKFDDIKFDSITRFYPVPINLVLPYQHNNVTFDFAAIEPSRPNLVNYRYMLEGYDDEWSPASNETSASFGNIREGNYTFKLKARSPDGVWSEPLVYSFRVLPPWYRTWWAYGLYILVFVILLWGFIRWRLKVINKEKLILEEKVVTRTRELQQEKEKVESTLVELEATQEQLIQAEKKASIGKMEQAVSSERLRISRELHDEVGATLSSISIFSQAAIQKNESGDMADSKNILERIGETSREVMGELNDTVWLINPVNDNLQKIIQRISNYALPLCKTNDIRFEIIAAASVENLDLSMEKRKAIYLIIKEAVNNSLKYAAAKNILINFEKNHHVLHISIKDDGVGFAENNTSAGNGLNNMKQRAADVNGKIDVESVQQKGTEIILQVPITQLAD